MTRAFRSEWLKLRRRWMYLTGALICVAAVLGPVIGISRARSTGGGSFTLARLAQSDGFFEIMSRTGELVGLLSLGVVANAVASEFQHGTLRNLLVRQPDRLRLLAGKVLACLSWLAVVLVLATTGALAAATLIAPSRGLDTSAWFQGSGLTSLVDAYGDTLLEGLGFGLAGAVLALMLRQVTPAVVGGFAWLLPIEGLLVLAWSDLQAWLPGRALTALGAGGTDALPFTHALIGAALWMGGATALAALTFRMRDVAA